MGEKKGNNWKKEREIKAMRRSDGSDGELVRKLLPKRRNLRSKISGQGTAKRGIAWLSFFEKKLNARGVQTVASYNGNFVVPDRDGQEPQFLMPHPCIPPSSKPLFTTRYFGDIYTVEALKFEVKKKNVNGTKIIIIDSEVSVDYEEVKKNEVVIVFRNDDCHFIWIEDEKKRVTILNSLNHVERVMQGVQNSWTYRYSGMLKPPEYSMLSKNEVAEIVSNAFDKSLSHLIEEAGVVVQDGEKQIITMGVT